MEILMLGVCCCCRLWEEEKGAILMVLYTGIGRGSKGVVELGHWLLWKMRQWGLLSGIDGAPKGKGDGGCGMGIRR